MRLDQFCTHEKVANDDDNEEEDETEGVGAVRAEETLPHWLHPFTTQYTEHHQNGVQEVTEMPPGVNVNVFL